MGTSLAAKLDALRSHPTVGDIRGKGLMQGIEFVQDKSTKAPSEPQLKFCRELAHEAVEKRVGF